MRVRRCTCGADLKKHERRCDRCWVKNKKARDWDSPDISVSGTTHAKLIAFCRARGLRVRDVVERALRGVG